MALQDDEDMEDLTMQQIQALQREVADSMQSDMQMDDNNYEDMGNEVYSESKNSEAII
jgi:hypothetical protein